jgi:hypothetical protein
MMVVDREPPHRVDQRRLQDASCRRWASPRAEFVGRRVEEVVPNTLMAQVIDSGQPILVDLLTNKAGTFLVSRLPLRDAAGRGHRRHRHGAAGPPRDHACSR